MLLTLLTIALFSCVADDPVVPSEEKGPKLEMKYLALGDCYTKVCQSQAGGRCS